MTKKRFLRAGLVLLIFLGATSIACAASNDNGDYIVTPAIGPVGENEIVRDTGADKNITFWDLPLWIQLSVIGGTTLSTFALIKYLPLLLGKIFTRDTNPKLKEIVSYITENPGCLEIEIAKNLNLKRGTLRYYLAKLQSTKRVRTIKKGRIKGIFHITCSKTEDQKILDLHKKNEIRKKMIEIITRKPGVTRQELSSELNINKSTVHWHIKDLHADEFIYFEKDGLTKRYYPQSILLSD
ncbi:MAG: winged helix-turn-helix transcriptional regulator [Methanolobus sp.]|nr:winged helix-turn-helix transcriptional regulator [Methanolobus sp.]